MRREQALSSYPVPDQDILLELLLYRAYILKQLPVNFLPMTPVGAMGVVAGTIMGAGPRRSVVMVRPVGGVAAQTIMAMKPASPMAAIASETVVTIVPRAAVVAVPAPPSVSISD